MEAHLTLPTSKVVDPSQIQAELHNIWESFNATNTTRACLFNLIFYTQKDHRYAYIQKLADALVHKFPARVIFILHDPKGADKLTTSVSILSTVQGEFDVACDVIQIEASGKAEAKIPFLILPHILPDLPVYLIFGEDPSCKEPLFQALGKFANRMIFDSETAENLNSFAGSVLDKHTSYHVDIADLNWARLDTWRDILAATFHSPEKLEKLKAATKITLKYNAQATPFFCHTKIQALYLQAWLASRLDWVFKKIQTNSQDLVFSYQTPQGELICQLIPETITTLPPGLILSVDIKTQDLSHFAFMTNPEAIQEVILHTSTPGSCELPCQFLFSKAALRHSLVNEIYHQGTSQHFLKMLEYVQKMEIPTLC